MSCLVALAGCEVPSFLASFAGRQIDAKYALADRATVVIVDDFDRVLGGPAMTGITAQTIGEALRANEVIEEARLVPQSALRAAASELGEAYRQTPPDRVGRLVNAEQVIHVNLESVDLLRAPGVFEPKATAGVRVIDAPKSKGLFPEAQRFDGAAAGPSQYTLQVEMPVSQPERAGAGARRMMRRKLAAEIGRQVARLFYDHNKPPPGDNLK